MIVESVTPCLSDAEITVPDFIFVKYNAIWECTGSYTDVIDITDIVIRIFSKYIQSFPKFHCDWLTMQKKILKKYKNILIAEIERMGAA